MTDLLTALLVALTVWTTPTGDRVLIRHVRREGGEAYVARVAHLIDDAALVHGVDRWVLAALLVDESGLDPRAVGAVGETGVAQLHPRSWWGRHARRLCGRLPASRCNVDVSIDVGGEALRQGFEVCGSWLGAVRWYRSGTCDARACGARRVIAASERLRSIGGSDG